MILTGNMIQILHRLQRAMHILRNGWEFIPFIQMYKGRVWSYMELHEKGSIGNLVRYRIEMGKSGCSL